MYKDIISYELAEGITEDHLLKVAQQIVGSWMSKQEGFHKWEINKNSNGTYSDIVYWANKEAAKKAEAEMANIPNAGEWFACYKEGSIKSQNLTHIASFE